MASGTQTKRMKEMAACSICLNLMTEPVSISCGHSYCQICMRMYLSQLRRNQGQKTFICPLCRAPFHVASLRSNKQLGNLIDLIKEMENSESGLICEEHEEHFQLFCEDDGQLICWRCERAPQHQGHRTALVEDVCQGYKEKLQNALRKLIGFQEEYTNQKTFMDMQITKWKVEIETQRQNIRSDFKNLHEFLRAEEKSYLWRLEKEEEQGRRRLQESEDNLRRKCDKLKSQILELEKKSQSSAHKVLQNVKETLNRACAVQLEAPEALSLEVQTVCNVAELYMNVKEMLRCCQVEVTLDPDTAHPNLFLSKDRKQVSHGCNQQNLEISPRRFTAFPCVLGCEGFTSGRHYFEVDVGEGTGWDVGVCMENVERGYGMRQKPEHGFWAIRLCTEKGYVALTSHPCVLDPCERPLVVGVALDYEAGAVSFYSMTSGSHIFTFPRASFSGTLWPFFQVYQYSPLFLPSCSD